MGRRHLPGSLRAHGERGEPDSREQSWELGGTDRSPRSVGETGSQGRANTETGSLSTLFHLKCRDEGNHVSTNAFLLMQVENALQHSSY